MHILFYLILNTFFYAFEKGVNKSDYNLFY